MGRPETVLCATHRLIELYPLLQSRADHAHMHLSAQPALVPAHLRRPVSSMDGPARLLLDQHAALTILRPVVSVPGSYSAGVRYLLVAHHLLHDASAFSFAAKSASW